MKNTFLTVVAALCALALFVGCEKGPKKVHITGTVTVGERTVDVGSISFDPVDGQGPSDGASITDGKFEADVTTGQKKVTVYGSYNTGEKVKPDPVLNPDYEVEKREDIPANVLKEEITVTIEKKGQVVD